MLIPYLSQQPVDDFGLNFSTLKYSATLVAATDTTFVIPGAASRYKALIKVDGVAWVALNAVAAVPTGATFAASTSELIDQYVVLCREIKAGDTLHFYSTATPDVSIVLYALNTNT